MKNTLLLACLLVLAACTGTGSDSDSEPSAEVSQQMSGSQSGGTDHEGAALYAVNCAVCHDAAVNRAPHRSFLQMMAPDMMLQVLNEGVMQQQSSMLSVLQKDAVVDFLVGSVEESQVAPVLCGETSPPFDLTRPPRLKNWGMTTDNRRFIPAETAQLAVADIPNLELKWAFAYPGASRARSQPAFAGGYIYVGSQDGTVYALEQESGCIQWQYRAGG